MSESPLQSAHSIRVLVVSIFSSYLYALTVSKEGVDVVTNWQLSSRAQILKKEAAKQVGAESFFRLVCRLWDRSAQNKYSFCAAVKEFFLW